MDLPSAIDFSRSSKRESNRLLGPDARAEREATLQCYEEALRLLSDEVQAALPETQASAETESKAAAPFLDDQAKALQDAFHRMQDPAAAEQLKSQASSAVQQVRLQVEARGTEMRERLQQQEQALREMSGQQLENLRAASQQAKAILEERAQAVQRIAGDRVQGVQERVGAVVEQSQEALSGLRLGERVERAAELSRSQLAAAQEMAGTVASRTQEVASSVAGLRREAIGAAEATTAKLQAVVDSVDGQARILAKAVRQLRSQQGTTSASPPPVPQPAAKAANVAKQSKTVVAAAAPPPPAHADQEVALQRLVEQMWSAARAVRQSAAEALPEVSGVRISIPSVSVPGGECGSSTIHRYIVYI
jgi:hypothetical protein